MKKYAIIIIALLALAGGYLINSLKNSTTNLNNMKTQTPQIIRQPAVAGQFYPANKDELNQMIDGFLNNVKLPEIKGQPQILIVPHAGYVFSGQTAAYGFKTIQNQSYENVILLGSSHNYPIQELTLYNGDAVKTPLGQVQVNKQIVEDLINDNQNIVANNEIHEPEHSLEVEIPFLQKILSQGFQGVLGLVNNDNLDVLESMAESIKKVLEKYPQTLIVISSDLSHYPNYNDAIYSDKKVMDSILTKDAKNLTHTISSIKQENRPGLDTCACGNSAIKVGMYLADKLNLAGQILNYSNSGDTEFGDKDRVVGYGAVLFTNQESRITNQGKYLNTEEQQAALKLARNTLELEFGLTDKKFEDYKDYPIFNQKRGVFVTLHTKQTHQLRGCIGLIEPTQELGKGIIEMAISAAFHDYRFTPLTKEELNQVEIEVSVLTPPEKINDPEKEIQLGKHGVIVRSGKNSGVYLPQVATETGWDLETFMKNLCTTKARLGPDCWKDGSADVYIYEAQVFGE